MKASNGLKSGAVAIVLGLGLPFAAGADLLVKGAKQCEGAGISFQVVDGSIGTQGTWRAAKSALSGALLSEAQVFQGLDETEKRERVDAIVKDLMKNLRQDLINGRIECGYTVCDGNE